MRKLKPETEIRNLKSDNKRLKADRERADRAMRLAEKAQLAAEKERDEWRERFDKIVDALADGLRSATRFRPLLCESEGCRSWATNQATGGFCEVHEQRRVPHPSDP